jgi:hypothetical protein
VNAQIPKITLEKPVLSRPIDPDSLPKHLAADSSGNVWFSYSAFTPLQLGFFIVASGAVTRRADASRGRISPSPGRLDADDMATMFVAQRLFGCACLLLTRMAGFPRSEGER